MFPKSHFGSTSDWSKNIVYNAVFSILFSLLCVLSSVFVLDTDVYQLDFL